MTKKDYIAFANEIKNLFIGQYMDEYGAVTFEPEQKSAILLMFKRVFSDDNENYDNKKFTDFINK